MSLLYHAFVYFGFLILACTIYILTANYLKKEKGASDYYYFLKDINGDNISELFYTHCKKWNDEDYDVIDGACFIHKGKVKTCDTLMGDMSYNAKRKWILCFCYGSDWRHAELYKISKNSIRKIVSFGAISTYDGGDVASSSWSCSFAKGNAKEKSISEKRYDKLYKKYIDSKKWSHIKPKKNALYSYKKMLKKLSTRSKKTNTGKKTSKLTKAQKKYYVGCLKKWIDKVFNDFDGYLPTLKDTKECTEFALVDLNRDGKKELCVDTLAGAYYQNSRIYIPKGTDFKITQYVDGKRYTKSIRKDPYLLHAPIAISAKGFKTHYEGWGGVILNTYYKVFKGKIREYARYDEDSMFEKTVKEYYVCGKKVTKSKFKKAVRSLGKFKKIKYHKYTNKNINKYLK